MRRPKGQASYPQVISSKKCVALSARPLRRSATPPPNAAAFRGRRDCGAFALGPDAGARYLHPMTLHLVKLCVGVERIEQLTAWGRKERGRGSPPIVHTRQTPKRAEEILQGGSLFWLI